MGQYELALEALHSLKPGEKPNRFRGSTGSTEAQYNNQRLLSKEQSRALIKWINQLTKRGLPPTNSMLENFAREISGKEPGKNWASRWIKAHSDEVISRYSEGLDSDGKKADSEYKYALYCELIGRKIEQYNLMPEQIYSMDEKGFMLGVSTKEKRIFTRRKYEQGGYKQHLQDGNQEWPLSPDGPIVTSDIAAIFPAHPTHTLQPLDDAIFSPLSAAYTEQLRRFINDCQGFTQLTERDLFRLFWASWNATFISKNINSAFKHTGLYPFNPELVMQKFTKKIESKPSPSDSRTSIIPAKDWRRLEKLIKSVIEEVLDQKFLQLNNMVLHLSAENILLENEIERLQRALIHAKKRPNEKKPLLLDLPTENEGGALFLSPSRVQQARDKISQKDEQAAQEQARKDDKKLQQQLTKQAKEVERAKGAQIQQEKREQRQH
uniref:Jerky protein like-like n=1 Tax=Talaromyces marneffei PM1 TaxID=1077442 RepID=A0A093VGD5_TALMA